MEEVIERLRQSRKQCRSTRREEGVQAGLEWAKNVAEADHLESLDNFDDQLRMSWQQYLSCLPVWGIGESLMQILEPFTDPAGDASEFWNYALDGGDNLIKDRDFAKGFIDAALSVWREVKSSVCSDDQVM